MFSIVNEYYFEQKRARIAPFGNSF